MQVSQDADQFNLTYQRVGTTSCAIVKIQQMLHSAMEPIDK